MAYFLWILSRSNIENIAYLHSQKGRNVPRHRRKQSVMFRSFFHTLQLDYASHVLTTLGRPTSYMCRKKGLYAEVALRSDRRAEVRPCVCKRNGLAIPKLTASVFSVVRAVRGRLPPFLLTDSVFLKFFFLFTI